MGLNSRKMPPNWRDEIEKLGFPNVECKGRIMKLLPYYFEHEVSKAHKVEVRDQVLDGHEDDVPDYDEFRSKIIKRNDHRVKKALIAALYDAIRDTKSDRVEEPVNLADDVDGKEQELPTERRFALPRFEVLTFVAGGSVLLLGVAGYISGLLPESILLALIEKFTK